MPHSSDGRSGSCSGGMNTSSSIVSSAMELSASLSGTWKLLPCASYLHACEILFSKPYAGRNETVWTCVSRHSLLDGLLARNRSWETVQDGVVTLLPSNVICRKYECLRSCQFNCRKARGAQGRSLLTRSLSLSL